MHWFRRVVVALVLSLMVTTVSNAVLVMSLSPAVFGNLWFQITWRVINTMIPIAAYGLLSYYYAPVYVEHHRLKNGLCLNCGYSLRGNTSGVCPECGEQI